MPLPAGRQLVGLANSVRDSLFQFSVATRETLA